MESYGGIWEFVILGEERVRVWVMGIYWREIGKKFEKEVGI